MRKQLYFVSSTVLYRTVQKLICAEHARGKVPIHLQWSKSDGEQHSIQNQIGSTYHDCKWGHSCCVRFLFLGWKFVSRQKMRTIGPNSKIRTWSTGTRELQRDVVYIGWSIAPLYMSPIAGGGGVAGSQPMSTAVNRSPNKLGTFYSIYNLCSVLNP